MLTKVYDYRDKEILVLITDNNKIVFSGNDLAKALGHTNPNKLIKETCKRIIHISNRDLVELGITGRSRKGEYFINRADVNRLLNGTRLKGKEDLRDHIDNVIIPDLKQIIEPIQESPDESTESVNPATDSITEERIRDILPELSKETLIEIINKLLDNNN